MSTVEVIVGTVGRAHGLRGEVAVDVRTDEPERRFVAGSRLRAEASGRPLTVATARWHGDRLLVTFAEAGDRTAAELLRGTVLVTDVPAEERPADPEEFYDRQLVGLAVLDSSGAPRGSVRAVVHLPGQDLLAVTVGEDERLVPFVTALVPEVDLEAGVVRLADVPGLLDDAGAEVVQAGPEEG